MRKGLLTIWGVVAFCLGSAARTGQDSTARSILLHDYRFAKEADPWITSENAAALTRYGQENMATAELSMTGARGGFTDFNDAPTMLQADAGVESFFRLNSRTVLSGSMSYNSFSGHDMAGSALLTPPSYLHLPFDIVEDSLTNTGTKHRDTYCLTGAFGTTLWRGASLGMRLDYTAANYAKYKDLRHKNKLMDMAFTAGIYVPLGSMAQAGAYYSYHRTTQSVQFSTYGKSDRTYVSLISYGPFIGHLEQFGQGGYTDKSREMPLVDNQDALGLQFSLQTASLTLYNAVSYARRRGYYGRRSPYTITYTSHHSNIYRYNARLSFSTPCRSRFILGLTLQAENLENAARPFRELQNDAGATYYEYYQPVKMANRLWVDGSLALTAHLGISGQLPAWTLQGGMAWAHRRQTAYLYPYARRQNLTATTPYVSLCRNIPTAHAVWSLTLDAAFSKGKGAPCEDFTLATPSDKQSPPPSMDAYLMREYSRLTSPQYAVGGTVKYTFILTATNMKTYVKACLHHRKANATNEFAAGRDRTAATLAIGCDF